MILTWICPWVGLQARRGLGGLPSSGANSWGELASWSEGLGTALRSLGHRAWGRTLWGLLVLGSLSGDPPNLLCLSSGRALHPFAGPEQAGRESSSVRSE